MKEQQFVIHFGRHNFWAATPLPGTNMFELAQIFGPGPGEYYRVDENNHRNDLKFHIV